MKKKKYLVVACCLIVLVVIIFIVILLSQKVKVITDKKEYLAGDNLKVKIKNNLTKALCLSSCYPYYLEKKEENWKTYPYGDCPETNLVENCIGVGQLKSFELELPTFLSKGYHRLTIPACLNCGLRQSFKEDQKFYSNEFIVK